MKKSIMAAICAVTLLMGTAYANGYDFDYNYEYVGKVSGSRMNYIDDNYPITHPYYMPAKGDFYIDAGYDYTKTKFKGEDGKAVYPNGWKEKIFSINSTYALSTKWFFDIGYEKNKTKYNPNSGINDFLSELNYMGLTNGLIFNDKFNAQKWNIGFSNKFIDNDKNFSKISFSYWQNDVDNEDKGFSALLFCGLKSENINPYIKLCYINTTNHSSSKNDGTGIAALGFYKQVNDKFGFNFGVNYTQETDEIKDKYLEGVLDLRYAFTPNCALKIGYGFQLSDSQHKFNAVKTFGIDQEVIEYLSDGEKYTGEDFKPKSRNHFFASLMFAF